MAADYLTFTADRNMGGIGLGAGIVLDSAGMRFYLLVIRN